MTDFTPKPVTKPMAVPVAVGLWMAIQTLVIGFSDSIRLWPNHPAPPQSAAAIELIVVQITAVALFCRMIDQWSTAILMAASAVLFGQIAAIQASIPSAGALRAQMIVIVWIAGARLTQWRRPGWVSRLAPALFTIWVFLPPLLRIEKYDQTAPAGDSHFFDIGIIDRALRQIDAVDLGDIFATFLPALAVITLLILSHYASPIFRDPTSQSAQNTQIHTKTACEIWGGAERN